LKKNIAQAQIKLFWHSCEVITTIKHVNTPIKFSVKKYISYMLKTIPRKKKSIFLVGLKQTNQQSQSPFLTGCPAHAGRFLQP